MIPFFVFYILLSALHLYACFFNYTKLRWYTKPLLLLSLAVFYAFAAKPMDMLVLAALALGLIGDILLIWPKKKTHFLVGALSFSAGHMCYIISMARRAEATGSEPGLAAMAAVIAVYAAAAAVACAAIAPKMSEEDKAFKPKLPAYLGLVAVLCAFAWRLALVSPPGQKAFGAGLMALGATLFLISDSILSKALFAGGFKRANFYVMLTYSAAQACLAAGFILNG